MLLEAYNVGGISAVSLVESLTCRRAGGLGIGRLDIGTQGIGVGARSYWRAPIMAVGILIGCPYMSVPIGGPYGCSYGG